MEKKQALDQQIMEEQIYAELWRQDMLKKEAREKKEREEKAKLAKDTLQVLDWQNSQKSQATEFERQKAEQEKAMLNSHWDKEA